MDLVRKGRLSVQRVHEKAWNAVSLLAKEGGWEEVNLKPKKGSRKVVKGANVKHTGRRGRVKGRKKDVEEESEEDEEEGGDGEDEPEKSASKTTTGRKRKALEEPNEGSLPERRSTRAKR